MKLMTAGLVALGALVAIGCMSSMSNVSAQNGGSFTGTVERVWEDGFRLNTGGRTLRVDSWDLYGDATGQYVSVGDQLTVTGEFDGRDFDAFSITSDGNTVSAGAPQRPNPAVAQGGTSHTGTVESVWEDGFRLNTEERTLRVDAWSLCGDFTANAVTVGDRLTVTGEFDGGEFDAFSITNGDGASLCR
ncbi:MAG: hypothetical protein ACFB8W_04405 [Elainellaceae cyanobacterium]